MKELIGCFNESADLVHRIDEIWSDTNLDQIYNDTYKFERLKCRHCEGLSFEVLITDNYQTTAKCNDCGMYYIVHNG